MRNAITFDVEDYFHVGAFADRIDKRDWGRYPNRVEANTERSIELLEIAGYKGTFFVLGWVAERFPHLVNRIAAAGHEVGCHSSEHRRIFQMTHQEFREDTIRAKQAIEDAAGVRVRGYRAPSFSITEDSQWAYEILIEAGFVYDSSIFPVRHPDYGMSRLPRIPFLVRTRSGTIIEFPMSTLEFGDRRAPFAGGAYLRLLPYSYTRWGIYFLNQAEQRSVCIYVHPWELDPEQPHLKAGLTSVLRHYIGLGTFEKKLRLLLRDFEFATLESLLPPARDLDLVLDTRKTGSAIVPTDTNIQNLEPV
jgi:polysaccharide deacetylase family protein (PEP-CTERM system associated)